MQHRRSKETEVEIKVLPTGLHLSTLHSFLGASSDGLVTGELTLGCLEIKCPFSLDGPEVHEKLPSAIALSYPRFFLQYARDGALHLKREHKYFAQVQGEMAVMGVQWCDFVVFTAAKKDNLFVERSSVPENQRLPSANVHLRAMHH